MAQPLAKLIKAWADGAEIQYNIDPQQYPDAWDDDLKPQWFDFGKYRIKPN